MNTALWIVQGILAAMFLMAGTMKAFQPIEKVTKSAPWAARQKPSTIRLIGFAETFGALGLVLPMLLGIVPMLTPLAACGLALVMALAMIEHGKHKEYNAIAFNLILLAMCIFVAYGRF